MTDFKNLEVWQKSRELVKEIYELTKKFPKDEVQGLTGRIRETVILLSGTIAKAESLKSENLVKEKREEAVSSTYELISLLILAHDLGYLWDSDIQKLEAEITEIQSQLNK